MDLTYQFFEQLPEATILCDARLALRYANRAARELFKLDPGDYEGRLCKNLSGDAGPCLNCPAHELIETGNSCEKEIYHQPTARWFLVRAFPIQEDGSIIAVSHRDITSSRLAETILVDFNYKVKNFIDRMPMGSILFDPDFKILMWNAEAEKIFGYSEQEAIGKHPYELIVPADLVQVTEPVKQRLQKGHDRSHRTGDNINKSGQRIVCKWINTPVRGSDGDVVGVLSMVQDITKEKELEKEAIRNAQLASIGQLAASVAHEVNSPLNGIINYAQIIRNHGQADEKSRDMVRRISVEADRIEIIVKNLLHYARDSKDQRDFFDIRQVVDEALSILAVAYKNQGVRIGFAWQAELPNIYCNFQQIEQVVINIIRNAYQALSGKDPDQREIRISADLVGSEAQQYLQLIIANNGPAIPMELLEKIKQPFMTTKKEGEGTGLGLSIATTIMQEHGGDLQIRSGHEALTEMILHFPVTEGAGLALAEATR